MIEDLAPVSAALHALIIIGIEKLPSSRDVHKPPGNGEGALFWRRMAVVNAASVEPGTVFADRYEVLRILGKGGMGCVFAATDRQTQTTVAIKCLWPNLLTPEMTHRFEREGRLASRLKSRHVVRVLDVGTSDSGPYMVMEQLEGQNLRELARGRALPVHEAVGYLLQAIDAVAEAHGEGIIHRDIKPANLFVASDASGPVVKVLDFGVSKTVDSVQLTKSDVALGSPPYMPPEQFSASSAVDRRADVWSIGVTLYELLTGVSPFEAETLPRVCFRVLSEEPPAPSSLNRAIPPALDEVVFRCLRKDANERFASCAALAEALLPFTDLRAAPDIVKQASSRHLSVPAVSQTGSITRPFPPREGRERWRFGPVSTAAAIAFTVAMVITVVAIGKNRRSPIEATASPAAIEVAPVVLPSTSSVPTEPPAPSATAATIASAPSPSVPASASNARPAVRAGAAPKKGRGPSGHESDDIMNRRF